MDNTDYRITLDITDMSAPISLNVKQGDAGRSIEVHLSRDGVPVAIESGSYAVFAGKKPDGKVLWNSCTIQDNRILYEITKQTTAVIGWVPVQIRLYRPGGKLVTSPDFVLIVDGTVTEDDEIVIISENEVTALTELVSEARAVIDLAGKVEGKSAYQVAVDNGFEGTEEEWLESLVGPTGPKGDSTTISLRYGISSEPMENTVVVWQDTIPQMSKTYPYLWIEISTETKTSTGGSIVIEKGIIGYYSTPGSGGNADYVGVEPADNDVPQVYLTGIDGVAAPTTKEEGEVAFQLHYVSKSEEFTAYCTLKLQGDSSANATYMKKNYTVKMFSDSAHESKLKKEFRDWGFSTNKYILKANWIDVTHARQMVAYDIWSKIVKTREGYADSVEATLPNQGTSDGFPIVVYINDTYYGIYTWILPKSDTLFGVDEDDANQFVIYGQLNTNGTFKKTANNFRALWSGRDVDNWEIEVGTNGDNVKTAVNNFTNFVMTATDEEFYANLGNYCDVNSLIDGYLFDYYLCGIDTLAQNMILICRDGVKFTLGVWDRDSSFGLWWDGSRALPATYRCPEDYQEPYSLLWARLEGAFYNELKARKAELRADGAPLSFGNIVGTFDTFVHNIGDDRYDENNAAYSQPSKGFATKKQFREFVRDRLAYVDSCVDSFGTVIKCADITLSDSDVEITNGDGHSLSAVVVPSTTTQELTWESSNTNVAVVENGKITPVADGSVTITAKCGHYSASCNVVVSGISAAIPCTGISLSASELTFTEANTQTLTATVTPDGCTDAVIWESDNTEVATVSNGVVTAVGNGSATITAKCGEYSASCGVSVSFLVEGVPLYPLKTGSTGFYDNGATATMSVTNGNHVKIEFTATVTDMRLVLSNMSQNTAIGNRANHTATANDPVLFHINAGDVLKYKLKNITGPNGLQASLLLRGLDNTYSADLTTSNYTFGTNTSAEGTKTVNTETDLRRICMWGGSGCNAGDVIEFDLELYVNDVLYIGRLDDVHCSGITLDKTQLTFDGEGTQTITATVTPADTTDIVVWGSSDPDVASIAVEGNICTVQSESNGNAVITVTCGDYSASCNVSVSGYTEAAPLYPMVNGTTTFNDTGATLTVTHGNHVRIEFTADTGLKAILSDVSKNGSATANNNRAKGGVFTIPSGAEVTRIVKNIEYSGTASLSTSINVCTASGEISFSNLDFATVGTENSKTVATTAENDCAGIGTWINTAPSGTVIEYDIELYVDGVRYT